MSKRLSILLLAIVSILCIYSSCDKKSSADPSLTLSYNASVYIGGDDHVIYALDPASGKKNWEFSTAAPIFASPLVYNERVYVASNGSGTIYQDSLYKLNAQTGALIKTFSDNTNPFHVLATPTADGNLIFLAGTNNKLYALDTGTFAVKWTFPTFGAIRSSPVVYNGFVYFGCDDGNIYGVNETDGATNNVTFNPAVSVSGASVVTWFSSPAIGYGQNDSVSDTVLCIGGNDSMYCLQLAYGTTNTATLRWAYPTHGAVNSSPTIYGGACIFGSDDFNVYCVDINDGTFLRWKYPTGSSVSSSPYAYKGTIYIGSNDYYVYAIHFFDGTLKWNFRTAGMVKSSPIVYNNCVFVGSYDKSFYAIDTQFGQQKWQFRINNNIETSPAVDNNTGGFGTNSSISGRVN